MSIFDPHPTDSIAEFFDELANSLLEQGDMLSPAELHGCLCGLLGGGLSGGEEALLAELEQALDISLHGSLADAIGTLRSTAIESIGEGSFDFQPLLPEDELELSQRIEAMAQWCRGFLSGYAQARVKSEGQGKAVLPDSAEALRDFAAIAQAASDEEDEDEDSNAAEESYYELLEYLRVAAMNVMLDAGVGGDEPAPSSDDGRSLDE
ncbi:UPF0149 family protein [Congregibacter sp.]|uniref:UPF0149 family protein n=1 Tax=Congregibacter sp. TaxID=2744308 RepID=UPI003F6B4FE1